MTPYAQKNYPQIQGINGRYPLSAIGCFVTSFCNLFGSFGRDVDPLTLNNELVAKNIYIDIDDGIRDDLGWSSITQDDYSIVVSRVVDHGTAQTAGWPATNEAIVRFRYRSISEPTLPNGAANMIFHFCKVADALAHTIVDSWDGVTKQSPYGEPTAFAEYVRHAPAAITPPLATPAQVQVAVPAKPTNIVYSKLASVLDLVTNKQPTSWWGLNFTDDAHAVAVGKLAKGISFPAYGKAQRTDGDRPVYYMTEQDFGEADVTDVPLNNNGVNTVDLSPAPALVINDSTAPIPPETPVVADTEGDKIPVHIVQPAPDAWKTTLKINLAGDYIAQENVEVENLDGVGMAGQELTKGQTVHVAGFFTKDGKEYALTVRSKAAGIWYAIPKEALAEDESMFDLSLVDEIKLAAKNAKSLSKIQKLVNFEQRFSHLFQHKK